jgi:hypothetical protein
MKIQKTKGLLFIIGGIILAPVSYWAYDLGIAIDALCSGPILLLESD